MSRLTCFFTILGICGNLSVLMVRLRESNKSNAHVILITALAVFDSVALVTTAFNQRSVHYVFGNDIRAVTSICCKRFISLFQSSVFPSSSVVVLICIERYVAVWLPLRSRFMLSRKTVLRCICCSVTFGMLVCTVMSFLYCEIKDWFCYVNLISDKSSDVQ